MCRKRFVRLRDLTTSRYSLSRGVSSLWRKSVFYSGGDPGVVLGRYRPADPPLKPIRGGWDPPVRGSDRPRFGVRISYRD